MKIFSGSILFLGALLFSSLLSTESIKASVAPGSSLVEKGKTLPEINNKLSQDFLTKVSGGPWLAMKEPNAQGKVVAMFYVDPDEKDLNLEFEKALDAEKFSKDKFLSMALINMDATILPNFAIESSLKSKQKAYPDVMYVKDFKKVLVKDWGLDDNTYVLLLLDKTGKLIFKKSGKMSEDETKTFISLIKTELSNL